MEAERREEKRGSARRRMKKVLFHDLDITLPVYVSE